MLGRELSPWPWSGISLAARAITSWSCFLPLLSGASGLISTGNGCPNHIQAATAAAVKPGRSQGRSLKHRWSRTSLWRQLRRQPGAPSPLTPTPVTIQTTLRLQKKVSAMIGPSPSFSASQRWDTCVRIDKGHATCTYVHTCVKLYLHASIHIRPVPACTVHAGIHDMFCIVQLRSLQWASSVEKWKVPADHLRCTSSKVQRQGQNQNVFHVGVRQPLPGSAEHLRTQSRLPARFSDSCLANFNQNPMVQTLLPLVRAWLWFPLVTSLTYRFQHVFACCTQALYHHRGICTTGN